MTRSADAIIYLKKAAKELWRHPDWRTLQSILDYYRPWQEYHASERNSLEDQLPWMSFSAIDFLKRVSGKDMTVFEYGSGGSTLFWASRVQALVSIEHDRPWFYRVKKVLMQRQMMHVDYVLAEPTPDPAYSKKDFRDPDSYISNDKNYSGKNFSEYAATIDKYPDGHFDIIIIDGRARPSCIKHSLGKLKKNGYLVVDNSERSYYLAPFRFNRRDWVVRTFAGPVPYSYDFSETTIFTKIH